MPSYGAVGVYIEEEEPLILYDDCKEKNESKPIFSLKFFVGLTITFVAIGLTLFGASLNIIVNPSNFNINESDSFIQFSMSRIGYDPVKSIYGTEEANVISYEIFKNYSGIIEPYSPMKMYVLNPIDGASVTYIITHDYSDQSIQGSFATNDVENIVSSGDLTFSCDPYDTYTIKIFATTSTFFGSKVISQFTGSLLCIYVRREIRALQPVDLNDMLDALHVLYNTSETEGIEKYGSNFHSSTYLCDWHFFTAARQDADHIHEGNGFLPQHVKATNLVEMAMQAVNPSVTLPYWDFTIDGESGITMDESPIFTPEIFGSITLPKDPSIGFSYSLDSMLDAAIPDGRWAYSLVEKNTKYTDINQPFGYLRAPWNMNPSPYVSRYIYTGDNISLSACSDYVDLLNYTDINDFLFGIPLDPHGHSHLLPGGVFGCELLKPIVEAGYVTGTTFMYLCSQWGFVIKEMYRHNLIVMQTECEITTYDYQGVSNCSFVCVGEDSQISTFIINDLSQYEMTVTDEGADYLVDFICNGVASKIFVGDHLESASPADPSFWPIHPTLERALQAKLLAGGFENEVWSSDPSTICERYECFIDNVYSNHTACCYGHYSEDRSIDYVSGNSSQYVGLRNSEVMAATDPRTSSGSYSVPYIYENFQWDHCEGTTSSIIELLQQLKQKYLTT